MPTHGELTEAEPDAEVDVEAEAGAETVAASLSAALTASIIENNPAPMTSTQQGQLYAAVSASQESLLEWHPGPSIYNVF